MKKRLEKLELKSDSLVELPLSKSIVNRLLIAAALCEKDIGLNGLSLPEDVIILQKSLESDAGLIDVGMAGTAMRFMTAYLSIQEGREVELRGAERMHQRPIGPLVSALKELGANIDYLGEVGFPPLKIKGKKLQSKSIEIESGVSSQFITSLLLIAPYLENGLELNLLNDPISFPYIRMTVDLMTSMGIKVEYLDNKIQIHSGEYSFKPALSIERDWSSAAFFFEWVAITPNAKLGLKGMDANSVQGDSALIDIFSQLGVVSSFKEGILSISQEGKPKDKLSLDLKNNPDLAPAILVTAAALGIEVYVSGIKSLRIKESDRILALKNELRKMKVELEDLSEDEVIIHKSEQSFPSILEIDTYNDHRIAMAFTPLVSLVDELVIKDPEVVKKSFPAFWNEVAKVTAEAD